MTALHRSRVTESAATATLEPILIRLLMMLGDRGGGVFAHALALMVVS